MVIPVKRRKMSLSDELDICTLYEQSLNVTIKNVATAMMDAEEERGDEAECFLLIVRRIISVSARRR